MSEDNWSITGLFKHIHPLMSIYYIFDTEGVKPFWENKKK